MAIYETNNKLIDYMTDLYLEEDNKVVRSWLLRDTADYIRFQHRIQQVILDKCKAA
jgi:hypothetical protein